uniref:Uncharacterized protein n=1 Tax=Arundo donax TaxID=35708 RepID=A0A0A9EU29_ARUDO
MQNFRDCRVEHGRVGLISSLCTSHVNL